MADLNNLLDEINNASEDEDTPQTYIAPQDAPPTRSTIPAALTAAADERTTDALKPQTADRDDNNDQEETHLPDPEYEQLKSLWSQELSSPELLPADAETVSLHVDLLEGQEETIDHLLEQSKESRGSNASGGEATGELASLMAQITKMDLDRTRYMLVDLARTRMAKIENFALHNKSLVERMTDEEVNYLRQYGELLEKHYRRTVLNHLPKEAWKKLDEPEMIDSPNLEEFVFCRVLEPIQIDVSGDTTGDNEEGEDLIDTIQEHGAGSCLIVMYKSIREFVLDGKVELLM
ncbi:hypothetical protein ACHAXN_010245 [Cyclotella atomus]